MSELSLLGAPNLRTLAYLQALESSYRRLKRSVLLASSDLGNTDLELDVFELALRVSDSVFRVEASDPNDSVVRSTLSESAENVYLYSGPPGALLTEALLGIGKVFIHAHSGDLPRFRGSTTMYYEILARRGVSCSILILDKGIDTGRILFKSQFQVPNRESLLSPTYDAEIRAKTLVHFLDAHKGRLVLEMQPEEADTPPFYVIHPVIKHLAILSCAE